MTEDQQRILDESRATLERLRDFQPTPRPEILWSEPIKTVLAPKPKPDPPLPDAIVQRLADYSAALVAEERAHTMALLPELIAQLRAAITDEIQAEVEKATAMMRLEVDALKHEATKRAPRKRASNVTELVRKPA